MKKALIAGAASVALAAMPVVGVFATTTPPDGTIYGSPLEDDFTVTLTEVCTLSRKASNEHTAPSVVGQPINGDTPVAGITGTWSTPSAATDTFTVTLVPGSAYAGIATSTYNVTCNSAVGGYEVKVDTTGFSKTGGGGDTWSYVAETAFSGNDESQWFLTSSAKTDGQATPAPTAIADEGAVWTAAASSQSPVTTSDFTITYNIMAKTTQQVGEYTASATYTLVNL